MQENQGGQGAVSLLGVWICLRFVREAVKAEVTASLRGAGGLSGLTEALKGCSGSEGLRAGSAELPPAGGES